jgi:hypothetical protein
LLTAIGFQRDGTVSDVCRMTMTRASYVDRYGKPNEAVEDIGV